MLCAVLCARIVTTRRKYERNETHISLSGCVSWQILKPNPSVHDINAMMMTRCSHVYFCLSRHSPVRWCFHFYSRRGRRHRRRRWACMRACLCPCVLLIFVFLFLFTLELWVVSCSVCCSIVYVSHALHMYSIKIHSSRSSMCACACGVRGYIHVYMN